MTRARIAILLLLATQVGVLALVRYRADLDGFTFLLTYWLPVAVAVAAIVVLWPTD